MLVIAVGFSLIATMSYAEKTLHLSISEYKPWIYKENNIKKGIVYDILMDVGDTLGYDIQSTMMPYKRTYAALASGKADMNIVIYSDYTHSTDYPEQLHVADESLFELKVVGATLARRNLKVNTHADLSHFRLGGRRIARSIYRGFVLAKFDVSEYAGHEALLKGLLAERIDVAILSMESFGVTSKAMGVENLLEASYRFPMSIKLGVGWSKPALGDQANVLSSLFCDELKNMKRTGKIAAIINRYSSTEYFSDFGVSTVAQK